MHTLPADSARPPAPARDRQAALALACVPNVGPVRWAELAHRFGGADEAFVAAVRGGTRDAALRDADRALGRAAEIGSTLLLLGDATYPPALLELPDPPSALWTLGDASLLARHPASAAVVGTRAMSAYGERATRAVTAALAEAGAVVVSGMALGVDGVAHLTALDGGGASVAVLGTGVDVPYPAAHRAMYDALRARGAVISEQLPGTRGTAGAFPRRNRIIAALARATVVTEAGAKSGALITAGAALDLGRTVAAVPGPIDLLSFAGSNALLRDGATVIAEPADALALIATSGNPDSRAKRAALEATADLPDDQRALWDALLVPHPDADALAAAAGLSPRACAAAVAALEIAGHIETDFTGAIRRR